MTKLLMFELISIIPISTTLFVGCSSKEDLQVSYNTRGTYKKGYIKSSADKAHSYYNSLKKDKEGFPIHLDTEFIKGQGDLSVGRIVKHLKKYLKVSSDGSKITRVTFFERFGLDNLWFSNYFNDIDLNTENTKNIEKSLWNSGYPSKKWISAYTNKSFWPNYNKLANHAKSKSFWALGVENIKDKSLQHEYVWGKGWKRFFNKKNHKKEFEVFISGIPILRDPTKMRVQMIVTDTLSEKFNKKSYFKNFNLGIIPNIIPDNISTLKYKNNTKDKYKIEVNVNQTSNVEKIKETIKDLADFNSWKLVYKFLPNDPIKHVFIRMMSEVLSEKNKQFVKENIDEIYNLVVKSPYIDVNKLVNKEGSKDIEFVGQALLDKDFFNHFKYTIFAIYEYIKYKP